MNVEEVNNNDYSKNTEMVERWPIKDSPFTCITIEDKHFGVMGEYRVTEEMESRGAVEDELRSITWNRIIQVMMILDEIRKKDKDFDEKVNNALETNK